jgi:hypothetical protein
MANYIIDFCDVSPTAVEQRSVETLAVEGLAIPDDCMQFVFLNNDLSFVAPHYFVTETVDFGDLSAMTARYPDARPLFEVKTGENDVDQFALITWSHPAGERWAGKLLLQLSELVAVVERASGKRVHP